jgi:hypothetical protein
MNVVEILEEIGRLPLDQQNDLKRRLLGGGPVSNAESLEQARREFDQSLLDDGILLSIPTGDDDDDDFEPIEVIGEPVSVTIINERR